MRTLGTLVIVVCMSLCIGTLAIAADNDNHQVTVTVVAINELAVTGGDITLTINAATAGSEPDAVNNTTCGLQWTTTETSKKITVVSDLSAPDYTLQVQATSVTGGTSAGQLTVSDSAQDLVTGVAETTGSCTLSYTASCTASEGTGSSVHTITYTITAS
ncbi:MAG: hypothetical protein ACOZB3_03755 [Calditrichota bacterium]